MPPSRPTLPCIAAIALASIASLATSEPQPPSWSAEERWAIEPRELEGGAWVTYAFYGGVEYPRDADVTSVTVIADIEVSSEADEPALTVEVRDMESDTLLGSQTSRGEEGSASLRVQGEVFDFGRCESADAEHDDCEHEVVVRAGAEADATLSGELSYTVSGGKEAHDEPDPDVRVDVYGEELEGEGP